MDQIRRGSALLLRVRGNSAEISLPLIPDRRSEVNQRAVVIEVAISRANVTHERDLRKSQPSFSLRAILPHSTLHFPSCGSFGPLVPPCTLLAPSSFPFRVLFLEKCSFFEPDILPLSFSLSRSFPFSRSASPSSPLSLFSHSLHHPSLSIYFSLFGAVDRVTSNVNQSAGIVASFLRQWFSIFASKRHVKLVLLSWNCFCFRILFLTFTCFVKFDELVLLQISVIIRGYRYIVLCKFYFKVKR